MGLHYWVTGLCCVCSDGGAECAMSSSGVYEARGISVSPRVASRLSPRAVSVGILEGGHDRPICSPDSDLVTGTAHPSVPSGALPTSVRRFSPAPLS